LLAQILHNAAKVTTALLGRHAANIKVHHALHAPTRIMLIAAAAETAPLAMKSRWCVHMQVMNTVVPLLVATPPHQQPVLMNAPLFCREGGRCQRESLYMNFRLIIGSSIAFMSTWFM
jgi:hypothetical protein